VLSVAFADIAQSSTKRRRRTVTDFHAAETRIGCDEEATRVADVAATVAFKDFLVGAPAMRFNVKDDRDIRRASYRLDKSTSRCGHDSPAHQDRSPRPMHSNDFWLPITIELYVWIRECRVDHAHIGMMIYQADNWPAEYRGHLFTLNLHGRPRPTRKSLNAT